MEDLLRGVSTIFVNSKGWINVLIYAQAIDTAHVRLNKTAEETRRFGERLMFFVNVTERYSRSNVIIILFYFTKAFIHWTYSILFTRTIFSLHNFSNKCWKKQIPIFLKLNVIKCVSENRSIISRWCVFRNLKVSRSRYLRNKFKGERKKNDRNWRSQRSYVR